MAFSIIGWIDQVLKNELTSAFKTRSTSGDSALAYTGQGNNLCAEDSVRIHITRSRHVQIIEVSLRLTSI